MGDPRAWLTTLEADLALTHEAWIEAYGGSHYVSTLEVSGTPPVAPIERAAAGTEQSPEEDR